MATLNLNDIREVLSAEIGRLQAGETTAASLNALSNATGKLLNTVKLEMEFYKLTGKPVPAIPMLAVNYSADDTTGMPPSAQQAQPTKPTESPQ